MITGLTLLSLSLVGLTAAGEPNAKRGLCFVDSKHKSDYQIWTQPESDLTWYYNYTPLPSTPYSKLDQDDFEFVPMMWGVGANPDDTTFLSQVKSLIRDGRNITHVLGFNEPNAHADWGGSNVAPDVAARAWVANFEPLGKMGIKLGLPGCMGSWDSLPWLQHFVGNCSKLVSGNGPKKNCTWDFLPVHWYDNFEGLQSHINERRVAFPGTEIWITEYAYAHQEAAPSKQFLDQTLAWFDKTSWIGRYTYFGAFRSDVSNVGPNAPFLDPSGKLTAIGQTYLGINGTGIAPNENAAAPVLQVPGRYVGLVVAVVVAKALTEMFR